MTTDANLGLAARDHSVDMTTHNYFSHTGRDGRMPDQRVRDSGYGGRYMGENIARGHGSPQAVVNAWMESTGHCNNIMRAESRDVGIGYASNYWTADFGR